MTRWSRRSLFMFRGVHRGGAQERDDGVSEQAYQVSYGITTPRSTKAYSARQSRRARAIETCGVRLSCIDVRTFLQESGQWAGDCTNDSLIS